jgi:hypothetical protein
LSTTPFCFCPKICCILHFLDDAVKKRRIGASSPFAMLLLLQRGGDWLRSV